MWETTGSEGEIVEAAREHGRELNMDVTREEALGMASEFPD